MGTSLYREGFLQPTSFALNDWSIRPSDLIELICRRSTGPAQLVRLGFDFWGFSLRICQLRRLDVSWSLSATHRMYLYCSKECAIRAESGFGLARCRLYVDALSSILAYFRLARYPVRRFNRAIPDRSIYPSVASGSAITLLGDIVPCSSCRSCSRCKGHTTIVEHTPKTPTTAMAHALHSLSSPRARHGRELSRCKSSSMLNHYRLSLAAVRRASMSVMVGNGFDQGQSTKRPGHLHTPCRVRACIRTLQMPWRVAYYL
jgi:hypothetical protein